MKKTIDHATPLSADVEGVSLVDGDSGKVRTEDDVLLERNDGVERTATKETDEVAADREEDESDVDVEDESGGAGDHIRDLRERAWVSAHGEKQLWRREMSKFAETYSELATSCTV